MLLAISVGKSYKAPFVGDNKNKHERKKRASREARRKLNKDTQNRSLGNYNKLSCSWDICDYMFKDSSPKGKRK